MQVFALLSWIGLTKGCYSDILSRNQMCWLFTDCCNVYLSNWIEDTLCDNLLKLSVNMLLWYALVTLRLLLDVGHEWVLISGEIIQVRKYVDAATLKPNNSTLFFFLVLCQWDLSRKFLRTSRSGESCKLRWTTTRHVYLAWYGKEVSESRRRWQVIRIGSKSVYDTWTYMILEPNDLWLRCICAANRLGVRTVWWNWDPNLSSTRFQYGTVVCV